ncbi:MAG TPA: aspartate aminotransferase family protein [Spirochaetota bacterium]|nr:aspartate aminotransferase family protein [Spirochaetota bacterium]
MSTKLKKIMQDDKRFLFQNYGDRQGVCFTRGEKSYLFDQDGKKYVDFLSGIAVCGLGYSFDPLKKAIRAKADSLLHSSNLYYNSDQIEAARLISDLSFSGKTLFVNSGTEANEAALKLVRKHGIRENREKYRIISFNNSFHGRTMGSMAATAQEKIHSGFGPLVPGFIYLPFNDLDAFTAEVEKNQNVAGVIMEIIQGEGGIVLADKKFVSGVFALCKKKGIITVIDEVQTGIGRTGKYFAYQHYGIAPDMITLAKGLAGGVPIGALHARDEIAATLTKGSHGCTFGGNQLASASAVAVLKELRKPSLTNNVARVSAFIFGRMNELKKKSTLIRDIRGLGLHIGIELSIPGAAIVNKALEMGLVINCTSEKVIRIMPALNIPMSAAREGIKILEKILLEEVNEK